jgi:hypothetical protein
VLLDDRDHAFVDKLPGGPSNQQFLVAEQGIEIQIIHAGKWWHQKLLNEERADEASSVAGQVVKRVTRSILSREVSRQQASRCFSAPGRLCLSQVFVKIREKENLCCKDEDRPRAS